mgnify:FL=1
MSILQDVKAKQPGWFTSANKRFFQDCRYTIRYGKQSGRRFLLRSTYMWSDMFGGPKTLHYRLNTLKDDLEIGPLVDGAFSTRAEAMRWLREH